MRMTRKSLLVILLGATFGGHARSAPIDCGAVQGNVEKAICGAPQLIATDLRLSDAFARRLGACTGPQRGLLRQTQHFWLRDRNNCANVLEQGDDAVRQCVADRMAERMAQLDRIGTSCDLDAVAGQYRFVDPGYLARFAPRYTDREVAVWGSLRLDSCDDAKASRLTGKLSQPSGKGVAFPVRFKAMPELRREWLCNRDPASHWQGTVRREGGKAYLYLSDILGEPL
jgi:uncharacterized protein